MANFKRPIPNQIPSYLRHIQFTQHPAEVTGHMRRKIAIQTRLNSSMQQGVLNRRHYYNPEQLDINNKRLTGIPYLMHRSLEKQMVGKDLGRRHYGYRSNINLRNHLNQSLQHLQTSSVQSIETSSKKNTSIPIFGKRPKHSLVNKGFATVNYARIKKIQRDFGDCTMPEPKRTISKKVGYKNTATGYGSCKTMQLMPANSYSANHMIKINRKSNPTHILFG